MASKVATRLASQGVRSTLKDKAFLNMYAIVVALLVFHDETSSLNVLTVEQYE